jgi:hypothetical protein
VQNEGRRRGLEESEVKQQPQFLYIRGAGGDNNTAYRRLILETAKLTRSGNSQILALQNQYNRLLNPFRRETLVKLMDILTWLQSNLDTALHIILEMLVIMLIIFLCQPLLDRC